MPRAYGDKSQRASFRPSGSGANSYLPSFGKKITDRATPSYPRGPASADAPRVRSRVTNHTKERRRYRRTGISHVGLAAQEPRPEFPQLAPPYPRLRTD